MLKWTSTGKLGNKHSSSTSNSSLPESCEKDCADSSPSLGTQIVSKSLPVADIQGPKGRVETSVFQGRRPSQDVISPSGYIAMSLNPSVFLGTRSSQEVISPRMNTAMAPDPSVPQRRRPSGGIVSSRAYTATATNLSEACYLVNYPPASAPNSPPEAANVGRVGRSISLPGSPQRPVGPLPEDARRKNKGVFTKFKNLFRRSASSSKKKKEGRSLSQESSPSKPITKPSPELTRQRLKSPLRKKTNASSPEATSIPKTRLTRLIEAKREQRKSARGNMTALHRSSSYSSNEECEQRTSPCQQSPAIYGDQLHCQQQAATLSAKIIAGKKSHNSDIRLSPRRDNIPLSAHHRKSSVHELADIPPRYPSSERSLRRSLSWRSNMNSLDGSFHTAAGRNKKRWSTQSDSCVSRQDRPACDMSQRPTKCPEPPAPLNDTPNYSDTSLFEYAESLLTRFDTGSLQKVKVMPSRPDKIIKVRESLTPVSPRQSPRDSDYTATSPQSKTMEAALSNYKWILDHEGRLIMSPSPQISQYCELPKGFQQQESPEHSGTRNNNNGHHRPPDKSVPLIAGNAQSPTDAFTCEETKVLVSQHSMEIDNFRPFQDCRLPAKSRGSSNETSNDYFQEKTSPLADADVTCKVGMSISRVRDAVNNIERRFEENTRRALVDSAGEERSNIEGLDTIRQTVEYHDYGHSSEHEKVIQEVSFIDSLPDKLKEEKIATTKSVQEVFDTGMSYKKLHNDGSSGESLGFSPNDVSISSDKKIAHLEEGVRAAEHVSESESDVAEYSCTSQKSSNGTNSIVLDIDSDINSFVSDSNALCSENSDIESLVCNAMQREKEYGEKAEQKPGFAVSTSVNCTSNPEMRCGAMENQIQNTENEKGKEGLLESNDANHIPQLQNAQFGSSSEERIQPVSAPADIMSDHEEGITDVKPPIGIIMQDSSTLEEVCDCGLDLLGVTAGNDTSKDEDPGKGFTETYSPSGTISSEDEEASPQKSDLTLGNKDVLEITQSASLEIKNEPGEDTDTSRVKTKKKVSFKLDIPSPDVSSRSDDVALMELTPPKEDTTKCDVPEHGDEHSVRPASEAGESCSHTDISSSFSEKSNDAQGVAAHINSTSADDVSWWGPEVLEDMEFFFQDQNMKEETNTLTCTAMQICQKELVEANSLHDPSNVMNDPPNEILTLSSFLSDKSEIAVFEVSAVQPERMSDEVSDKSASKTRCDLPPDPSKDADSFRRTSQETDNIKTESYENKLNEENYTEEAIPCPEKALAGDGIGQDDQETFGELIPRENIISAEEHLTAGCDLPAGQTEKYETICTKPAFESDADSHTYVVSKGCPLQIIDKEGTTWRSKSTSPVCEDDSLFEFEGCSGFSDEKRQASHDKDRLSENKPSKLPGKKIPVSRGRRLPHSKKYSEKSNTKRRDRPALMQTLRVIVETSPEPKHKGTSSSPMSDVGDTSPSKAGSPVVEAASPDQKAVDEIRMTRRLVLLKRYRKVMKQVKLNGRRKRQSQALKQRMSDFSPASYNSESPRSSPARSAPTVSLLNSKLAIVGNQAQHTIIKRKNYPLAHKDQQNDIEESDHGGKESPFSPSSYSVRTQTSNFEQNQETSASSNIDSSPISFRSARDLVNGRKSKSTLSPMTRSGSVLKSLDDQSGSGDCWESSEDLAIDAERDALAKMAAVVKGYQKLQMNADCQCWAVDGDSPEQQNGKNWSLKKKTRRPSVADDLPLETESRRREMRRGNKVSSSFHDDQRGHRFNTNKPRVQDMDARCLKGHSSRDLAVDFLCESDDRSSQSDSGHAQHKLPSFAYCVQRCSKHRHGLPPRQPAFNSNVYDRFHDGDCYFPSSSQAQFSQQHLHTDGQQQQQPNYHFMQFQQRELPRPRGQHYSSLHNDTIQAPNANFIATSGAKPPKKSTLDSHPSQWLIIATFFVFQLLLHWLYSH